MKRLINLEHHDEIKIDELKGNFNRMSIEINKKENLQQLEQVANLNTYPSKRFNSFCCDDDDEDYTVVITPAFLITDSLIMKNEHLDTILETESDEFIKSSVENLVPIPSESEDFSDIESECDMPDYDDSQTTNFSTFSNPLFDDSTSSDDKSSHEEEANHSTYPSKRFNSFCYDDDDEDYAIAVTPSLSIEELDNSLSMRVEHLYTIPTTESDEFIKSSVENLVPIPSEFEGVPDNMCDVPFHDNSLPLNISKDQFEDFSNSNDESTSTNDDSFSIDNVEYVEASPPNSEPVSSEVMDIVIPEVEGIDYDILLTIKDDILREKLLNINLLVANIEALIDNPTPSSDFMTKSSSISLNSLLEATSTFDNSLSELDTFCFDLEEITSGGTTTRSDISLPEYEVLYDDHVKEISSGSTTTDSDYSLYDSFIFDLLINPFPPAHRSDFYEFVDELTHIISPVEYDCFYFKIEPNSGDFTMDVVKDISPTREPRVHIALPTHPTLQLNLDFILSNESLFAYVVWIFLPFLSYSVTPQNLLSFGNEDTILIPASTVIISLLLCRMCLIGVELS
nr:hypothetical protein [Tanacetum cinerariifolium]